MIGAAPGPLVDWLAGIDAVLAFVLGVLGALVWVLWREVFGLSDHPLRGRHVERDKSPGPSAGADDSGP